MVQEIKIQTKVSDYLLKLCDSIQNQTLQLEDIPVEQIKKILNAALEHEKGKNNLPHLEILVSQNMFMLEQSILRTDTLMTIMTLQTMACQCLYAEDTSDLAYSIFKEQLSFLTTRNEYVQEIYATRYHKQNNSNQFSGKGVIYTAVTGGYDDISDPLFVSPDFDYICFTDNPDFKSDVWQIRLIENDENLDNVRLARKHKCLCAEIFPDYDYSIWIDGKLRLLRDPKIFINQYAGKSGILAFPHFERDCVYQEALACISYNKDDPTVITNQMQKLKVQGYPEHNGMIDSTCLIRNHHDNEMRKVMRTWWNEILTGSFRDQLSFNYACYLHNYEYDLCNLFTLNNTYMETKEHTK